MKRILLALVMITPIAFGNYIQLGNDINGEGRFGTSISLSSDGSVVAIGAPWKNDNGYLSGQVRVYQWDGSFWNQLGTNINGEAANDQFGHSVALSADGSIVAIGAPYNDGNGNNSGHICLYQWNGTSWNQIGNDIDGNYDSRQLGHSLSLSADGTTLASSSHNFQHPTTSRYGAVDLYKWDGSTWQLIFTPLGTYTDQYFGYSVSLSGDGNTLAVGTPNSSYQQNNARGYTYIYTKDPNWSFNKSFFNYLSPSHSQLGSSVSLNVDGTIAAIGHRSNALIYLYRLERDSNGNMILLDSISSGLAPNSPLELSEDGSTLIIGSNLYQWNGLSLNKIATFQDLDFNLGSSVSLSADGSIVAVGANNGDGFVRIYRYTIIKPVSNLEPFYECQNGETVSVSAIPTDGYPTNFTYQWIHNGYAIPSLYGGTESTYSISGSSAANGNYSVIVSNDTGSTTNNFVFEVYVDSDGDNLSDGRETYVTSTNPADADSDDDGLNDGDEINTYSTDPNDADSDNDGFNDGDEISGLDPTIPNADIFNAVESKMKDLRVGSQTFGVSNGNAKIRMYVDESGNLTDWTNTPHVLELDIPADSDTKFYRFRMD